MRDDTNFGLDVVQNGSKRLQTISGRVRIVNTSFEVVDVGNGAADDLDFCFFGVKKSRSESLAKRSCWRT